MRPLTHQPSTLGRINVTPMIDVIMVMIVFFLMVGKLAEDLRQEMDLPRVDAGARPSGEPLFVNVGRDQPSGSIFVDVEQQRYTVDELRLLLELRTARVPETGVHIRADRSLSYGAVEPVVRACRDAGVTRVRFAAESGSVGGS